MADGLFYVDTRGPFMSADIAAVTVIATDKALVPLGNLPVLGSNYWWVGKAVRIRMFGRWSTAATPGTQTINWYWGSGADATGTKVLSSQVITPIASLVNTSWKMEVVFRCRVLGGTGVGSLIGNGAFHFLNSLTLTTPISDFLLPATADAAVLVDLTTASVLSPQTLAVTSTTNTMQVHDYIFEALN
jgi:hypothetical protein